MSLELYSVCVSVFDSLLTLLLPDIYWHMSTALKQQQHSNSGTFKGCVCANEHTVIASQINVKWILKTFAPSKKNILLQQDDRFSMCKRQCLIICSNERLAGGKRHVLFCVHTHTHTHVVFLSLACTRSLSSRLFAQILTLVTGDQPNPTLASSALHTHTLFSDSLTRNDGAHLPNRPCNLFENLCLRDEEGSPPDFITFPWPQRLTDLIAQSLAPLPPPSSPRVPCSNDRPSFRRWVDEETAHSNGNPQVFNFARKLFAALKTTSLFSEWKEHCCSKIAAVAPGRFARRIAQNIRNVWLITDCLTNPFCLFC